MSIRRIRDRISGGVLGTFVVVILLGALVGFFGGAKIRTVVIPGPDHVRISAGPTVTITRGVTGHSTTMTSTSVRTSTTTSTKAQPVPGPVSTTSITPPGTTLVRTVTAHPGPAPTVTRTRTTSGPTVTVPGPTVRVTLPPVRVTVIQCFRVSLLGNLLQIACP